ncbi:cyclin-A1 isoform X2 [Rhincodon typus]|uniref:cyclin-A1 isoform X2 n=1 Tax=Rhincodon typus TaxID=259920 RepID=UPI00202F932A|nr:cyclin-A1 isoform X2 [Rhincodon typus]
MYVATMYRSNSAAVKRNANQENQHLVPQMGPVSQKQRTVLGVLNENDQQRRLLSQVSAKACGTVAVGTDDGFTSAKGCSTLPECPATFVSNPNFNIYMEDEVQDEVEVSECNVTSELESKLGEVGNISKPVDDYCLFLDLSEVSPMLVDSSMRSQRSHEDSHLHVDYLAVEGYAEDIYRYLREAEEKCRPKFGYMKKQPDITHSMRSILVDWLVEVGEEYNLQTETLYLAINYLDRFLSCMSVLRGKLQLVGTAAMLIASKYEEIYPPEIDEFVYITDDTYTKKQLLRMEHLLLKVLSFDMTVPTVNQFLTQFLKEEGIDGQMGSLAMYIAELSLLEADVCLKYAPSLMAAAAYCLANYTINNAFWPQSLATFSGYSLVDIVPCLHDMHKTFLQAKLQPQQAIKEKYRSSKYLRISLIEPPATLPLHVLISSAIQG